MENKVAKLIRDQEKLIRIQELRETCREDENEIKANIEALHETLDLMEEWFEAYKRDHAKLDRARYSERPWEKKEMAWDPLSVLDEQKKKMRQVIWECEAQIKAIFESMETDED